VKYRNIIILVILGILAVFCIYYFSQKKIITNYPSKGSDIIAFGDSLVEGYGATQGKDFVSLLSQKIDRPIINLGHSGDTTVDGIARIGELDKYNPKVVILLLGGNDSLRKMPVAETHKNLATLIENIQSRGAIVLLLGIKGGLFADRFGGEFTNLRDVYNTAFVSDVLDGLFGNDKYMSDPVHPNDTGYQMIADRIYPVLTSLVKE
jgi:lysophospholipase L1-like esterase